MNKSKKIIITGGAGFIGSTLLNVLVPRYPQYRFINIDTLTSAADLNNVIVSGAPNYSFHQIDIRDKNSLRTIYEKEQPTDIIHLAAESHVDVSIANPQIFVETNINGTANLLSLALEFKINRFHYVSTDEVYGSLGATDAPFTENSTLLPNSPYSASKAAGDCLVRAFNKTYGLNTLITRCSNNYGPRQDASKFIPNAITKLLAGEQIPVYGDGSNIRDWLYVEDHVNALDIVFHQGEAGEVYNIGGGTEKTNLEIATLLSNLMNQLDAIKFVEDRKGHDFRYAINDKKLRAIGYKPQIDLATGLKRTLDWYQKDHSWSPSLAVFDGWR